MPILLNMLYRWDRPAFGLALYDGADELALASVLDTYPRTFSAGIVTLGNERRIFESRHGLRIVPRAAFTSASSVDRLIVTGEGPRAEERPALQGWARAKGLAAEYLHAGRSGYAYDAALAELARREGAQIARSSARGLEYPVGHLTLEDGGNGRTLLLRPIALGLAGLLAVYAIASGFTAARRELSALSATQQELANR